MELKIINSRSEYCYERLKTLCTKVSEIPEIKEHDEFCIYVTGSYARFEGNPKSDLDLFFVQSGDNPVRNISKTLIDAGLIGIQRDMDLPDFTGDGEYLQIHTLEDITDNLGSRDEDYENYYTARMLLLTESKSVFNEQFYQRSLEKIIESYFRDFHDHETSFRPIFLTNDLIRFWKTLCLNYEHSRNRKGKEGEEEHVVKAKSSSEESQA